MTRYVFRTLFGRSSASWWGTSAEGEWGWRRSIIYSLSNFIQRCSFSTACGYWEVSEFYTLSHACGFSVYIPCICYISLFVCYCWMVMKARCEGFSFLLWKTKNLKVVFYQIQSTWLLCWRIKPVLQVVVNVFVTTRFQNFCK